MYGLALLTNRKFIIDITTPCDLRSLLIPNEIDWSPNQSINSHNKSVFLDCLNQVKSECLGIYNDEYNKNNNHNNNNKETPDLFEIKTNKDWITPLSGNKYLNEKILSIGFNSIEEFRFPLVFNKWYKRLFKLSPRLSSKYESIRKKASLDTNDNTKRKVILN